MAEVPEELLEEDLRSIKSFSGTNNRFSEIAENLCVKLVDVVSLDLSENKIGAISPKISKMKNLRSLNLSFNKLNNVRKIYMLKKQINGQKKGMLEQYLQSSFHHYTQYSTERFEDHRPSNMSSQEFERTLLTR